MDFYQLKETNYLKLTHSSQNRIFTFSFIKLNLQRIAALFKRSKIKLYIFVSPYTHTIH